MIGLETILAMEAKLWTTLDGLYALLRDKRASLADLKTTLTKQKVLVDIHLQNADEIMKAPIASLSEFKSLKEGTKRLRDSMKANLQKAQETIKEINRLTKEIDTNNRKLVELEVRANALKNPARVVELKIHEDKRSPAAD